MELAIALITLTFLEIVLGVDNVIFISILSGKLPQHQQRRARRVGLLAAMVMRLGLLASIVWISRLTVPLFHIMERGISGRDLILIGGGLFLLAKSVMEIHDSLEGAAEHERAAAGYSSFTAILVQITIIDIVFSLDSVITAVGMAKDIMVMVLAIVIEVAVMMFAAKPIGDFVDAHPTIKMLALSFLILVGVALVGEGLGMHIPKGYIYFAMAFSVVVEMLNLRIRKKKEKGSQPLRLRKKPMRETAKRQ